MVKEYLPHLLRNNIQYESLNELGDILIIYKNALKCLEYRHFTGNMLLIEVMNNVQVVLLPNKAQQYCVLLSLIIEPLMQLLGKTSPEIDQWLMSNISAVNAFHLELFKKIDHIDTEIIKWYFALQ